MAKLREPQEPGLAEVERALSLLEGRHPEHERARRETLTAAAERRRALTKERAALARRRRRRALVIALNVVAFAAAAEVGRRFFARSHALREDLDLVEGAFAQAGWKELASNVLFARPRLVVEVPASSCVVALSTNNGLMRVSEDGKAVEARGSVGFCTCESAVATVVDLPGPSLAGTVGVSVMRIDARAIGGPLARGWATPALAAWGDGGMDCADSTLDAWLADGHAPGSSVDDAWLGQEPARIPLRRAGFHVVGGVPAARPFGVVATTASRCMLAVAEENALLSLRLTGGKRPILRASGSMVWCSSQPALATVWRDGISPVVVLAAPAEAVGGSLGTRECAAPVTHVGEDAVWLGDADLVWDAASVLRASLRAGAAGDVVAKSLPAEPGAEAARLVALTLAPGASVASEPRGAAGVCDPPLDGAAVFRESVCMRSEPVSWWRRGDATGGVARASLPFWLAPIETWQEPTPIALVPKLLALARHLGQDGFVPTLLEGVTELTEGIRVVGRANEDAVVAVGLGQAPPWVFPFTNERMWSLGESPISVPLRPGESVKLIASPLPTAPLEKRRTVVFRREARP